MDRIAQLEEKLDVIIMRLGIVVERQKEMIKLLKPDRGRKLFAVLGSLADALYSTHEEDGKEIDNGCINHN